MFEVFDSHVHIYPEKIADKASVAIGDFYSLKMDYNGNVENLLIEGKRADVKRFLVHSVATTTAQVRSINQFILSQCNLHPEFIGFITLHPDLNTWEIDDEISRALDNNMKGIKLHPDFQKFYVDEIRAYNIYNRACGKLPILFHAGDKRTEFSTPERIAKIAREYPDLTVIAAHFGGYSVWDRNVAYQGLKNVYFDTSSSLKYLTKEQVKSYIERFGADHFFFGTDYPMWDACEELDRFMAVDLTDSERQMILADNLKRVLNL